MNDIYGVRQVFSNMHVDIDPHVGGEFVELHLVNIAHKGPQGVVDY